MRVMKKLTTILCCLVGLVLCSGLNGCSFVYDDDESTDGLAQILVEDFKDTVEAIQSVAQQYRSERGSWPSAMEDFEEYSELEGSTISLEKFASISLTHSTPEQAKYSFTIKSDGRVGFITVQSSGRVSP